MRAAVVVFPGSNCDHDMIHTLREVLRVPTQTVWHRDPLPEGLDLVVLPGGFSFGDYLRCGAIARQSPVMEGVRKHAERGGLLLGVCNGFQILTEAQMLPGALTRNAHRRFECRDIYLRADAEGPFTRGLPSVLRVPIAHADGRYQIDPAGLAALKAEGRIAFRYCTPSGDVTLEANPNGAMDNIAGIYGGPRKNVLGMMPHPERLSEAVLGGTDGRKIFESALAALHAHAA
ncbi:MAG: phosphoribosylformylglycinamidine synthase subunit PurQ [Polyangiales bacterium]